jgi:hypothetical protein
MKTGSEVRLTTINHREEPEEKKYESCFRQHYAEGISNSQYGFISPIEKPTRTIIEIFRG